MLLVPTYDPMVLAAAQAHEFTQRVQQHQAQVSTPPAVSYAVSPAAHQAAEVLELARQALKALEWIERSEEVMLRAEEDCLVEYSEANHAQLQGLYEAWLTAATGLAVTDRETATELHTASERVAEWLRVQESIRALSLPHADLAEIARQANLSAGARGVATPPDA